MDAQDREEMYVDHMHYSSKANKIVEPSSVDS